MRPARPESFPSGSSVPYASYLEGYAGQAPVPIMLHVLQTHNPQTGQRSVILGSRHTNNPNDWHYAAATEYFEAWEERTRGFPRMVCHEGLMEGCGLTAESSIRDHYGESGLLQYWAKQHRIESASMEPPFFEDIYEATKIYGMEETLLYVGIRETPGWQRMRHLQSYESYMATCFDTYNACLAVHQSRESGRGTYPFSYDRFRAAHSRQFGVEPDGDDVQMQRMHLRISDSCMDDEWFQHLPVARVAVLSMETRDRRLMRTLLDYNRQGYSIFDWHGTYHTLANAERYKHYAQRAGHAVDEHMLLERRENGEPYAKRNLVRMLGSLPVLRPANTVTSSSSRSVPG
jgi:hypothetical protein